MAQRARVAHVAMEASRATTKYSDLTICWRATSSSWYQRHPHEAVPGRKTDGGDAEWMSRAAAPRASRRQLHSQPAAARLAGAPSRRGSLAAKRGQAANDIAEGPGEAP